MSEGLDWDLARRTAHRLARRSPFERSYLCGSLHSDVQSAAVKSDRLIGEVTGLVPAGPSSIRVVSRAEWIDVNLASLRGLAEPITRRIAKRGGSTLAAKSAALQVGSLLGWVSRRVLGQYVVALTPDCPDDVVYVVAPNMLELEKRFGFAPAQFRLWVVLHEICHRAQFTGVAWMGDHFRSMVDELTSSVAVDSHQLMTEVRRNLKASHGLPEGGLPELLLGPERIGLLHKMQAMMSLLEGHAEVVMSRAAPSEVPDADRFHRVLQQRRTEAGMGGVARKLLGFDAKMRQYESGATFVRGVENAVGKVGFNAIWAAPSHLPTLEEIAQPQAWVTRIGASPASTR